MNLPSVSLWSIAVVALFAASACLPKPAPDGADALATAVAQAAFDILTQTAAAASRTPPPPTITAALSPTETATSEPTSNEPQRRPQTVSDGVACWLGGPGEPYALETHIQHGKAVDLLGVGTVPGWYVIRDPYFHRPCWIQATDLKIFPGMDPATYPVMTPGIPFMGQ